MSITPYQVMAPLMAFVAIIYAWGLVKKQKKSVWEGALWTVFWGMIALIAIYPSMTKYLSLITGIRDHQNAVLVTSIGVLFFVVFYFVIQFEEVEQRQVRLIRKIALREAGLDDVSKK